MDIRTIVRKKTKLTITDVQEMTSILADRRTLSAKSFVYLIKRLRNNRTLYINMTKLTEEDTHLPRKYSPIQMRKNRRSLVDHDNDRLCIVIRIKLVLEKYLKNHNKIRTTRKLKMKIRTRIVTYTNSILILHTSMLTMRKKGFASSLVTDNNFKPPITTTTTPMTSRLNNKKKKNTNRVDNPMKLKSKEPSIINRIEHKKKLMKYLTISSIQSKNK